MGIAIEFGQLTSGLSGILGIARGMADPKYLNKAMLTAAKSSGARVGHRLDALGSTEIAHVYEYGSPPQNVNATPAGRLWSMVWSTNPKGVSGVVNFRQSTVPVPHDPAIVASAARAGAELADHVFPDKAQHLETKAQLSARAGVQRHTNRIGGKGQPRALVFMDNGVLKFREWRTWNNEYHNKFREHFLAHWATEIAVAAPTRLQRATTRTVTLSARKLQGELTGRTMAPFMPRGMGGVVALDHGRPYTGIRMREPHIRRMAEYTGRQFEKAIKTEWQR